MTDGNLLEIGNEYRLTNSSLSDIVLTIREVMRIFKTRYFHRWAKSENLSDSQLKTAISELMKGLHDGDLGSYVYKKRIPILGKGKRGGLRTIIAYRAEDKAFFVYGYAKNVQANITPKEKEAYKKLSKTYFDMKELELQSLLKIGELIEVL
ncbi:hypothetical protein CbuD7D7780_11565 (plasmid) [Coxiella burnetii]|nr:hypothetical protein CbuD7E6568_11645 [Coxiella burnetii]OYK81264.1 hypothetical protein CbuD7D7780_11565 [Coxiella burnetii]